MRLNLTQHSEPYPVQTLKGLTDSEFFLDSVESGAWPFVVGGAICLANSGNERGPNLLNRRRIEIRSSDPLLRGIDSV
jgi:hypothetical protein